MTSADFHFKTYIFDLESKKYNDMENEFFNNDKDGFWVIKDPYGLL